MFFLYFYLFYSFIFFFKQKTAYEMCISDWSSDVCSSDLFTKRMPSAFFETPLSSYLRWHKIDTVVVTGGSTSGCVRATAVDALSYGFRTIVPIETCADKHESYHFANLTDLQLKYADVEPEIGRAHVCTPVTNAHLVC